MNKLAALQFDVLAPAALALLLGPLLSRLAVWLPRRVDGTLPAIARLPRWQQALFSLMAALLTGACSARYGLTLVGLAAMVFVSCLLILAWTDALTGLLPDALTLPLLWLGLLINLDHTFAALPDAVIGAAVGYLFFWLIHQIFLLLTRREGLGYGDFKLLAASGAWLGWQALAGIVLLASVSALIVTVVRRWRNGATMGQALYYGPYLALAAIARLFWVF